MKRAVAAALIAAFMVAATVQASDNRCDSCKITPAPTPRPTPVVVGQPLPTAAASATLPPTDTLP